MNIEITIKTKKNPSLRINLSEKGDWHIFDGDGNLIQRFEDFDIANMAAWLLDRNAEGGPFTVKKIKS